MIKNVRNVIEMALKLLSQNYKNYPAVGGFAIGVARSFDWGGEAKPQTTYNDVIRNFERGIYCGGKHIVEWKIRSRLVLARNQELVQGGGLKPIAKMSKSRDVLSKEVTAIQTYH